MTEWSEKMDIINQQVCTKKPLLDQIVDAFGCKIGADGSWDCVLCTGRLPKGYLRIRDLDIPFEKKRDILSGQLKELFRNMLAAAATS
jgi:hypothetical protein